MVQNRAAIHWLGGWTRAISRKPAGFRHTGHRAVVACASCEKGGDRVPLRLPLVAYFSLVPCCITYLSTSLQATTVPWAKLGGASGREHSPSRGRVRPPLRWPRALAVDAPLISCCYRTKVGAPATRGIRLRAHLGRPYTVRP